MPAAVIAGRVVDSSGRPLAGARVAYASGPVPLPDVAQVTGTDGTFAMDAPADGSYRITVFAQGRAPVEREVEVRRLSPDPIEVVLRG